MSILTRFTRATKVLSIALIAGSLGFMSLSSVEASLLLDLNASSASFSQAGSATLQLTIQDTLDGNPATEGWAIQEADVTTSAQQAYIAVDASEFAGLTPGIGGEVDLDFSLEHNFASQFTLGHFRLSFTTTAEAPTVGSTWIELAPISATALGGATTTIDGGGFSKSILIGGANPDTNTYTVNATASGFNGTENITGFRLEALTSVTNGLPTDGPGRGVATAGNFVLSNFTVNATVRDAPIPEPASLSMLAIAGLLLIPRYRRK